MLKKLFPPATELTLFVTAISLVSLFFYMDGWASTALEIIAGHFSDALKDVDKAGNIFNSFISFFTGVILLPSIILSCMIAPIIMPFTRWDLSEWAVWILLLDCAIISIYNIIIAIQTPTPIQLAITAYCLIWSVYVYLCMESNKIDYLIDKQKCNPRYTFAAGMVSMIGIFMAIHFFAVNWVKAYSISIVVVSVLFSFTTKQNSTE